jgi:hypothetical protein
MYNTKVVCTYNYYNPELPVFKSLKDTSDIDPDMEDVSSELYKSEFLQLFGLETFDNTIIQNTMSEVLDKIKDYPPFLSCLQKGAAKVMSQDIQVGFMILYSYHYFYITHLCVIEFLEKGSISEDKTAFLLNAIK